MAYNIIIFHIRQARKRLNFSLCVKIIFKMRKIAYVVIVIGLILIINSLLRSIYDLWHKQDLVTSAIKQLDFEKQKNQKLKADFQYVQTSQFIESQAYNKLFLVKPGEQQVLISQNSALNKKIIDDNTPNWQKWINLFL